MATLEFKHVNKTFGAVEVIPDVSLFIPHGSFTVFVGPSGCGKSTLLRLAAGLEEISDGVLEIDGKDVTFARPTERGIAMVFQSYALYPHMNVAQNIGFGLKMAGRPKAEIEKKVHEAAATLQLDALLDRKPGELSGGQRQRVAIGRAIVREPKVFLFDEPLSNLDAKLRASMRTEIKKLHQSLGTTAIYVTHDQLEAMTLATRMVVMKAGEIQQVGKPEEVYHRPVNLFVADFLGNPGMNFMKGHLRIDGNRVSADVGAATIPLDGYGFETPPTDGQAVVVGLRPESVQPANGNDAFTLTLKPTLTEHTGSDNLVVMAMGDQEIVGKFPTDTLPKLGEPVTISFDLGRLSVFDAQTERRI